MRNRRKREKDSPDAKPRPKEEKPENKKAEHDKPAAPAAPSSPSVDPTRIGNYQLGDSLGRGAFGRVWKGLNMKTGEVVAIKQINKDFLSPSQLPSIMQELELLRKLTHPRVVKFHEYHEIKESLYFVMEFVEGGSLNETMKKFGVFPEELLVLYIAQLLQGLEYLHSQKIVHRDIKGCNLLLTKEGSVKLADFGSCTYTAIDKQFSVVGTPFWMAPEVIEVTGGGPWSDIWSLGCTVLELLTGKPPYWDAGTMAALFKMVNDSHPPLPAGISSDLESFLRQCFVRETEKRPTPDQLLNHPWIRKALTVDTVETPAISVASKTIKEYNKRRSSISAAEIFAPNNRGSGVQTATLEKKIVYLESQVEDLTQKLSKAVLDHKSVSIELEKVTEEKDSLQDVVDDLDEEVDELKKTLAAEQAEKAKLQEEMAELKQQLQQQHHRKRSGSGSSGSPSHARRMSKEITLAKNLKEAANNNNNNNNRNSKELKKPGHLASASSSSNLGVNGTTADSPQESSVGGVQVPRDKKQSTKALQGSVEEGVPTTTSPGTSQQPPSPHASKRPPKMCESCGKQIIKNGRLAMARPWHPECFTCAHCKTVLEEFIEKDGKPYCVKDFNQLFGNRCGGCKELIQGQYIQAMNKYWHADHFKCCACNTVIQGGFIDKGDHPMCKECFKGSKKAAEQP